jgi:flagellin
MSLGILTNIAAIYAENNLNQTQSSLQNTLTQLSSGSRINSGADDAAGLSVVDGLQANVSALTQSSQNASDGIGLLQTADGALSQVTNLLNRAVTLATEAANGTLNTNQVSSANAEYQNILTEIGDIGSSTNFNGNSVFTSTAKTVFVSDGTTSGSDSYNEVVGTLGDSSVGETQGVTVLSLPTPTTPTATNTVQQAVSLATPTAVLVNPTPVAASATASATTTLTPVVTGDSSAVYSNTAIISTGVQAGSGGGAYTPSAVTAAPTSGSFSSSDTYSGVIGVRLVGANSSSQLYTASVAPGSSLQTLVSSLNNSFGYNPNSGTASTSGLEAQEVNNALVITTAPNAVGQVAVDAPTDSLQVNPGGNTTLQNVSFGSTGGVTTTTADTAAAQTSISSSITLAPSSDAGLSGLLNIVVGGNTVGSVNFGAQSSATVPGTAAATAIASALGAGTAFANAGYSYSFNSTTGALAVTAPGSDSANAISFTTGAGTGASGALSAEATSTFATVSLTPSSTTSYSASTVTLGAASPTTSDTYKGSLTVQLAGSAESYSATIATGSTLTQTLSALNSAFGSSTGSGNTTVGSIGSSGLVTVANSNGAILIESAAGAGQVVVSNASTLQVNPSGAGSYAAATVTGTTVSTGYTATTAATASTSNTSTVALGTASVAGSLNIYAGSTAQGTALGTINFGANSGSGSVAGTGTGANSVQAAIATTFTGAVTTNANANTVTYGGSGSLAGYSATYNTSSGALTVNGPSDGGSFSLGQATSGSTELETGSVSTTLTAGSGITVGSGTLYSGIINFGNNSSYTISSPATSAALATSGSALVQAATAAGLTVANVNNQLVFTSASSNGTPPAVTVTNGAASTEAYTASTVSFSSTNGSTTSPTFSGQFSVALDGSNYSTTFAAGTTGTQAVAILNGLNPGANASGVFGDSGLTASLSNGSLVITGPTPSAASPVANDQITVNSTNDLAGVASSTQTLTNANASAGTTYTGTISWGATGTTAAGSYTIGANGAGTTASDIAAALGGAGELGTSTSGLTVSVNQTTNQLVFSGPSTGTAQGQGPGVTLTSVTATAPTVTTYSASTAAFAANSGGTFSGDLTVGTSATGQIATTVAAGTTLDNLVTQLNNQYTQAGVSGQLVASAGTGTQAGQLIISSATPTTATQASQDQLIFSQATGANTLTATSATSSNGGPGAGVDFSSAGLDQLTADSAQTVLSAVTTAINDVAYQRGLIGADVNELTAASNVASAESVNLASAQSSIQSTDYGAATSDLAKYQVLSQTGISALAQANSVSQEVLKLLQ